MSRWSYRMLMRDTKNTGKHDEDESVYTKTVRTATGKVITVELDGLPGENKRPKDSVKIKERLDQYDEKVVPIQYEEPKEYIFPIQQISLHRELHQARGAKSLPEVCRRRQIAKAYTAGFGVGVTITNISRGAQVLHAMSYSQSRA